SVRRDGRRGRVRCGGPGGHEELDGRHGRDGRAADLREPAADGRAADLREPAADGRAADLWEDLRELATGGNGTERGSRLAGLLLRRDRHGLAERYNGSGRVCNGRRSESNRWRP